MDEWRIPLEPLKEGKAAADDGRISLPGSERTHEEVEAAVLKVIGNPFGVKTRLDGRDLNPRRLPLGEGWEPSHILIVTGAEEDKPLTEPEEAEAIFRAAKEVDKAEKEERAKKYLDPAQNPLIKTE